MRISDWSSDVCSSDLLCRGNCKLCVVRANTKIAADGESQTAADAITVDHRDGRLHRVVNRVICPGDGSAVFFDSLLVGALVLEFRDVGDRKSTRLNSSH